MSTKYNIPLVSLLLRLEVGLPFALFNFPLSLLVGLVFVISNYYLENKYHNIMNLRQKLIILGKSCIYNSIALAIAWFLHCKFIYFNNGKEQLDIPKIKVVLILIILLPILMVLNRWLWCIIERYILKV